MEGEEEGAREGGGKGRDCPPFSEILNMPLVAYYQI